MPYLNFSWVIDDKLAGHRTPSFMEDLVWLKKQGIMSLVRMAEKRGAEITSLHISQQELWDCYEPVPDFSAPVKVQIDKMVSFICKSLAAGRPVGVSCWGGLGRTGTILACYLVSQGYDADEAIDKVRAKRPGSIETESQKAAIKEYARPTKDNLSRNLRF